MKTQHLQKRRRKGVLSMELVLVLPIVMTVLFAVFEFSCVFLSRGSIVDAARAGARTAALDGASPERVEDRVRRTLGKQLGRNAQIFTRLGDRTGDEVIVGVRVPMQDAAPNMLWPIGYDLNGRYLQTEIVMVRE